MSRPIPPYNAAASTRGFRAVIPPAEYEALKLPSKALAKASREDVAAWLADGSLPEYVLGKLATLAEQPPQLRNRSARALLQLSYMLRFRAIADRRMGPRSVAESLSDAPEVVQAGLLECFAESAGEQGKMTWVSCEVACFFRNHVLSGHRRYRVPLRAKHKLVSYVLVLALMLDGFTLDLTTIAKDLKLSVAKCVLPVVLVCPCCREPGRLGR
eukprot:Opistho-1_new@79370